MKCVRCPLLYEWNNENDRGAECRLFGDGWNSQFQYEDEHGIVGCYIDRHYIKKVDTMLDEQYDYVEKKKKIDYTNYDFKEVWFM